MIVDSGPPLVNYQVIEFSNSFMNNLIVIRNTHESLGELEKSVETLA